MKSLSKRKTRSNQQKQARKIQQGVKERKKHHSLGKKLTPKQKKQRSEQLAKRKEAKQKRRQLGKDKRTKAEIKNVQKAMFSIFNAEILDQLAKATGFIKRSGGDITAFSFMYIVSFGFLGNGAIALTYLVAGLRTHFNVNVTPQALSKRINSASSVKFLKAILKKLIEVQLNIRLKSCFSETFSMFNGIYLQDSSQVTLNEYLSEDFRGQGGGASKSALKLDFIYDIANFLVYGMKITSATTNDQTHSKEILKYIKRGGLLIRDLGYFTISVLKAIQDQAAYYISRLSISTHIYLNQKDEEPLDVPKFLEKLRNEGKSLSNIPVYVGKKERLKTRLVAEKVPAHVSKQRRDRFKKDRKKSPSPYYIEWSGFSIFITNIPETMFSGKIILAIYKIRWQIELVFKNFKTNVEIDILKGTNKNRIESLVYGKLITITVMFIIQNYAASIAGDKEISGDKVVKLMKSDNRLREAIIHNDISMVLMVLECDLILICKQKRNKKTTYECIKEMLISEKSIKSNIMPLRVFIGNEFELDHLQNVI
jgi:hypothetical protein